MKKKIAIVIQRFGEEINGGAELHARMLAQRLVAYFDVDILTTCALDYYSWANHFPEGESRDGDIVIKRFLVASQRKKWLFDFFHTVVSKIAHWEKPQISWKQLLGFRYRFGIYFWLHLYRKTIIFFYNRLLRTLIEKIWMRLQGPWCTDLSVYLKENIDEYSVVIFYTYHYATSFTNLPYAPKKSILVPCAHEELALYQLFWNALCEQVSAIVYLTEEEKRVFLRRFPDCKRKPHTVVGSGIEVMNFKKATPIENLKKKKFVLYLGRIDPSKGCSDLFTFYQTYNKQYDSEVYLVLAGKQEMPIPKTENIINLGFVSIEQKTWLLENCLVLIMPSYFESLSLVILEAWSKSKPVLVNGHCEVLAGQVKRSNGGLIYRNKKRFIYQLHRLLSNQKTRNGFGMSGKKYYLKKYQWDVIDRAWLNIIDKVEKRSLML